ncbi:MAG: DJ-1/PfpI family protein [Candidatus Lokiarchaeota archaeon]|nr:DJ-1/PfpI family protein [Candidatus Lokiarchaeota archaeon]
MKEILCFIYDGFADFETVLTCSGIDGDENYRVTYIAYEKTPVLSSSGLKIIPDKSLSEINSTKNIEGLIIPGGGTRIFKPELGKLIKQLNEEKKLLAAICAGPEFLAKAGILKGKKYTTTAEPQSYEEKKEIDPFPRDSYVDTRIIQDGNIITAKGHAFTDFALEIWDWYNLYDTEKEKDDLRKDFTPD